MSENQVTLIDEKSSEIVEAKEPSLFQIIGQAASDPNFDAGKMQALIDMKLQLDKEDAKKAFNSALVEFHKNPPRIIKNAHVNFKTSKGTTDYKHATIDSVLKQLRQPLYEIGLTAYWNIDVNNGIIQVTCVLAHTDGHSIQSSMTGQADTSGGKNATQGMGSTVTYLKRYTLLSVLGLAEEGEDDDGIKAQQKKSISEDQKLEIENLIEQAKAELPQVCKYFKIGALHEMTLDQYGIAVNMLQSKIKVQNESS